MTGNRGGIMGYPVTGNVTITCTDPTQLTHAALIMEEVAMRVAAFEGPTLIEDMREYRQHDIIVSALEVSGFKDPQREDRGPDRTVYTAHYHDSWWDGVTFVHRLAAESGMEVTGAFHGSDSLTWIWNSRKGQYLTVPVARVSIDALRELDQASKTLAELVTKNGNSASSLADVSDKLRSIVASIDCPSPSEGHWSQA